MKTEVIFKQTNDGEVIAFFPYLIWDHSGNITSYQHIGQHGAASIEFYRECKPTISSMNLFHELVSIGYDIKVIKRINYKRYFNELKKIQ